MTGFHYEVYGLRVASAFELPDLAAGAPEQPPDVSFTDGPRRPAGSPLPAGDVLLDVEVEGTAWYRLVREPSGRLVCRVFGVCD
ncbi:MAG: hypothetical protein AAGC63_16640, partial [Propionicimonas sp.]|nr:hypothetical protein [Propionicimonas sp.]